MEAAMKAADLRKPAHVGNQAIPADRRHCAPSLVCLKIKYCLSVKYGSSRGLEYEVEPDRHLFAILHCIDQRFRYRRHGIGHFVSNQNMIVSKKHRRQKSLPIDRDCNSRVGPQVTWLDALRQKDRKSTRLNS